MIVLVTGATGQQGGAVAAELLSRDHQVRALTRRPNSPAAEDLHDQGAQIVEGSLNDLEGLKRAADGAEAIFGVTTPFEAGIEAEVRQGQALVDAAESLGVPLVFSSVAWAYQKTGIPHFDSKWQIEEYLVERGIPHTILGPAYFMENAIAPWALPKLRETGTLAIPLSSSVPLSQVAVQNIGDAAVYALENPEAMDGRRFDLAGDMLTGPEMASILTEMSGNSVGFYEVPKSMVEDVDLRTMYEWYAANRPTVDQEVLRKAFPEIHWYTFREWAEGQNWGELLSASGDR